MEKWIYYAFISMLFAGLTSVIAKFGMKNVSADAALAVRTSAIFGLVWLNLFFFKHDYHFSALTTKDILFLCLSGVTTTISWIFYYRAMKEGNVSVVATIDKGSIVVTLLLAFWLLKEPFTWKIFTAAAMIIGGLVLLVWK
ncbi:MAG: EamA family transporter [Bacteroidetes bacterium]|nr:EamA family transporter [Bacteroidota bacterium]